ncbi:MAG: bifunctional 3-demethylubiquinone-9 3-methyltransferase/ 2-octaprenyl-6-hydroxy phenol methylase [Parcubacteria group bacterium ADurb.Bin192]|nr:MAG: bifunctional 3-demethylubiquinone-9 3-methyltransferase/ 2-octaprenyl-6-hydroxy phenol methylase [Parcubacteria group bacterium ADurb.Bin192]
MKQWKPQLIVLIKIAFGFGILLFFIRRVPLESFLFDVKNANPFYLVPYTIFTISGIWFAGKRWKTALEILGIHTPMKDVIVANGYAFLYSMILPGQILGESLKLLHISAIKENKVVLGASFLIDKLFGILPLLILAPIATLMIHELPINLVVSILLFCALSIILIFFAFTFPAPNLLAKNNLIKKIDTLRSVFSPKKKNFWLLVLYGFLNILSIFAGLSFLALGLHIDNFYTVIIAFSIASIISILPITIAGIGVREGAFISIFAFSGLSASSAILISELILITNVGYGFICWFVTLFYPSNKASGVNLQINNYGERNQEKTLYSFLSLPYIYGYLQSYLGGNSLGNFYVKKHVQPTKKCHILDIGCGPGTILNYLPEDIFYEGYDINSKYIEFAKKKYMDRGQFYCKRVNEMNIDEQSKYEIVLSTALLHHLEDSEAENLFRISYNKLKTNGYLVTLDPVYHKGQNPISRFIISKDRGQHVRDAQGYEGLARKYFNNVEVHVIKGWTRVMPYTLCIMKCYKNR